MNAYIILPHCIFGALILSRIPFKGTDNNSYGLWQCQLWCLNWRDQFHLSSLPFYEHVLKPSHLPVHSANRHLHHEDLLARKKTAQMVFWILCSLLEQTSRDGNDPCCRMQHVMNNSPGNEHCFIQYSCDQSCCLPGPTLKRVSHRKILCVTMMFFMLHMTIYACNCVPKIMRVGVVLDIPRSPFFKLHLLWCLR